MDVYFKARDTIETMKGVHNIPSIGLSPLTYEDNIVCVEEMGNRQAIFPDSCPKEMFFSFRFLDYSMQTFHRKNEKKWRKWISLP